MADREQEQERGPGQELEREQEQERGLVLEQERELEREREGMMAITGLDAKSVELKLATVSEIADRENMSYESALRQIRKCRSKKLFIGVDEREQLRQLVRACPTKTIQDKYQLTRAQLIAALKVKNLDEVRWGAEYCRLTATLKKFKLRLTENILHPPGSKGRVRARQIHLSDKDMLALMEDPIKWLGEHVKQVREILHF